MRVKITTKEYRIVVPGKAVSFRSPLAKNYKAKIKKLVRKSIKRPLEEKLFDVHIDYFHVAARRMDMDNISKCVMDALNGVLYVDDKQVRYQKSVAHDLSRRVRIYGGPPDLVKPLRHFDEYLFIRIRESLSG